MRPGAVNLPYEEEGGYSAAQAAAAGTAASAIAADARVDNCVPERLEFVAAHPPQVVTDGRIAMEASAKALVVRAELDVC